MIKTTSAALIATLLLTGTASAYRLDKYSYLTNECTQRYQQIETLMGSQPIAASMQAACIMGLQDGLLGNALERKKALAQITELSKTGETGMGDPAVVYLLAQYREYIRTYDRGFSVTKGHP